MICDDLKRQIELFKKYKNGDDLDPVDSEDVRILSGIGFFHIGISLKGKKVTAKTLPLGLKILSEFE